MAAGCLTQCNCRTHRKGADCPNSRFQACATATATCYAPNAYLFYFIFYLLCPKCWGNTWAPVPNVTELHPAHMYACPQVTPGIRLHVHPPGTAGHGYRSVPVQVCGTCAGPYISLRKHRYISAPAGTHTAGQDSVELGTWPLLLLSLHPGVP